VISRTRPQHASQSYVAAMSVIPRIINARTRTASGNAFLS